jgi:futalosine hydrolase
MEGAALHYVGLQENIAFLQLRSVSNAIGVRDKTRWNIPLAIGRLNEQLIHLLQQLDTKDKSVLKPTNQ